MAGYKKGTQVIFTNDLSYEKIRVGDKGVLKSRVVLTDLWWVTVEGKDKQLSVRELRENSRIA